MSCTLRMARPRGILNAAMKMVDELFWFESSFSSKPEKPTKRNLQERWESDLARLTRMRQGAYQFASAFKALGLDLASSVPPKAKKQKLSGSSSSSSASSTSTGVNEDVNVGESDSDSGGVEVVTSRGSLGGGN